MKNKKLLGLILAAAMAFSMTACSTPEPAAEPVAEEVVEEAPAEEVVEEEAAPAAGTIILATTTSTKDSGLLDYILPNFTEQTGYEVDVISVGSGEAMAMGEAGEADVLLVHSPASEEAFVEAGHSDETGRLAVMYNDYVLVGPESDAEIPADDAVGAVKAILENELTFISRGDESGTHKKELALWEAAEMTPEGEWYVEAAAGMGDVITMADEMSGYTLSDRATWLNVGGETGLAIVCEKDPSGVMDNPYGVICVNPEKNDLINAEGAKAFQDWIVSDETQELIGGYGVEEFGGALFTPNAE